MEVLLQCREKSCEAEASGDVLTMALLLVVSSEPYCLTLLLARGKEDR